MEGTKTDLRLKIYKCPINETNPATVLVAVLEGWPGIEQMEIGSIVSSAKDYEGLYEDWIKIITRVVMEEWTAKCLPVYGKGELIVGVINPSHAAPTPATNIQPSSN